MAKLQARFLFRSFLAYCSAYNEYSMDLPASSFASHSSLLICKQRKFGVTLIWRIENIPQTFILELAIFVLLSISCIVNSPNFCLPTQQADFSNFSPRDPTHTRTSVEQDLNP